MEASHQQVHQTEGFIEPLKPVDCSIAPRTLFPNALLGLLPLMDEPYLKTLIQSLAYPTI